MSELDRLYKEQADRLKNAPAFNTAAQQVSPFYGGNPFEPSSYISNIAGDPKAGEPLPSSRFVDPNIPSDLNTVRMQQTQEMMGNTQQFLRENAGQQVNEQSLIDKGKTMLSRIFDYQDDKDAQIFGINMSAGETVWDGFLRHFVGAYDLLSLGFGGLISAAPGGIRTLSYDELSAGRSVGDILSGNMDREAAPSPGQIFVASVGEAARRVRDGDAKLGDFLQINGLIGYAALMAEGSPLQQAGFDLMDKEQREQAFAQGWEKWTSGITDFGLAFADPLVGAGVGMKVLRAGMLGAVGPAKIGARFAQYSNMALEELSDAAGMGPRGLIEEADQLATMGQRITTTKAMPFVWWQDPLEVTKPLYGFTLDAAGPKRFRNPLAQFAYDVTVRKADGSKNMSVDEIMSIPEIRAINTRTELADLLHKTDSPVIAMNIIGDMYGQPGARQFLEKAAPATSDITFRMRFLELQNKRMTEPQKVKEAVDGLQRVKENIEAQLNWVTSGIDPTDARMAAATSPLINRYQLTIRQAEELIDSVQNGTPIDKMNPQSAFYDLNYTDSVMQDLHRQSDVVTQALNRSLSDAAAQAKMYFPMADNPYARMVASSRRRRGTAAYQYSVEGTNILPKRVPTGVVKEGEKPETRLQWWSSSQFEGVGRFRRQARVWRWMGTSTPSGYIGLKGTSLVNQDRELGAVLDLDMYKSDAPIAYERPMRDKDGAVMLNSDGTVKMDVGAINGRERRAQLMSIFADAMDTPDKDPLKAILEIEMEVAKDLGRAYGFSDTQVSNMMSRANKGREGVLDQIRQRGFFIDPVDGARHYSPYLDSQMANGTYMHNFQMIEGLMRREALRDGGKRMGQWMDNIGGLGGGIYDTFNSFWRPAVLLRMSYTQRNVFEGMVRAMAFQASAAPLLWPVKATAFGIRNKAVARKVKAQVAEAEKALQGSDIQALRTSLDKATMDRLRWQQAFKEDIRLENGDVIERWYVAGSEGGRKSTYVEVDPKDIVDNLAAATARETAARTALEANPDAIIKALDGTEAGRWIQKQIAGQNEEIAAQQARIAQLDELVGEMDANGMTISAADIGRIRVEYQDILDLMQLRLNRIQYDPVAALNEYGAAAGRAKRIGSGTSLGPDGNYYNNAFEGPYDQLARTNMSADNTVKQALALHADVMGSLWRRIAVRTNAPIAWDSRNPDQWIQGMRAVIETASSDPLIRKMLDNDFDLEKTMRWLIATPQGNAYYANLRHLQGSEGLMTASLVESGERLYGETSRQGRLLSPEVARRVKGSEGKVRRNYSKAPRIGAYGDVVEGPDFQQVPVFADIEQVRQHIIDVQEKLMDQMQRQPGFIQLLRQRSLEKAGVPAEKLGSSADLPSSTLTDDAIRNVIASLSPAARDNLGFVQGSELIDMGTNRFMQVYGNLTGKMFKALGTIPEDAVTRGPFYASRFKAARDDMIEMYLIRTGRGNLIRRNKKMAAPGGREHGGTITHDQFSIPNGELQRIYYQAHRTALADTREWMYTIERRTKLGKYGEWLFPFISATQNSVVTAGKLLYKEPWLAPFIYDLWRAPQLAGFEDDQGNLQLPMPMPFISDWLRDNPDIPVVGGIMGPNDMITIPKNALNLWVPETGFGIAPRPTPWVQVGASELMKRNMFPVETPQVLKNMFGDEQGDEVYKSVKDYMFGEGQGPSSNVLSLDILMPAYMQKAFYSRDELSVQYGYQFQLQWATQMARFRSGDREDEPKYEEISKRTTNAMWFQAFGNFGMPTPLTPYPILTRPDIKSPVEAIQERFRLYQETDPKNAAANFYNDYGDLALLVANTKITKNIGGAEPRPEAVSDAQTLAPLIQNVINNVDSPDVLGILVNNRVSAGGYDDSSYEWQKSNTIPGTTVTWRQVQAPAQSIAERQRIVGWTEFRQFEDRLDAMLASAGLPNYEVKAAAEYKKAKQVFIEGLMNNPERDGWTVDYMSNGGSKAVDAVRTMSMALQDETFNRLIGEHDPVLLGAMAQYVHYRDITRNLIQQSGKSFNDPVNYGVKDAWLTIRQKLAAHPRFGEIMSMYLYGDENPVDVGPVGTDRYFRPGEGA